MSSFLCGSKQISLIIIGSIQNKKSRLKAAFLFILNKKNYLLILIFPETTSVPEVKV